MCVTCLSKAAAAAAAYAAIFGRYAEPNKHVVSALLRVMSGCVAKNQVYMRRTFAKARSIVFCLFWLTSAAGDGG